ncbi:MAG TPA: L,D-transpeptidase, partial [Aurantimonas sp.]
PTTKVARIVVDKSAGRLVAYDDKGEIVLADPATIGSDERPSPSGTGTAVAGLPSLARDGEKVGPKASAAVARTSAPRRTARITP